MKKKFPKIFKKLLYDHLNQFWNMVEKGHVWRDWDVIVVVSLFTSVNTRLHLLSWKLCDMIHKTFTQSWSFAILHKLYPNKAYVSLYCTICHLRPVYIYLHNSGCPILIHSCFSRAYITATVASNALLGFSVWTLCENE